MRTLQQLADSLRARQEEAEAVRLLHRLGLGEARALAVRSWPADLWALVDDDMTLLPVTSYRRAADRAGQPGVGIVSTLSVRGRQWAPGRLVDASAKSLRLPDPQGTQQPEARADWLA